MSKPAKPETQRNTADQTDPELLRKIGRLRSALRENFGLVVLALMSLPRYSSQSLSDLQHLVLDPMLNDRVAIAYPGRGASASDADAPGSEDRDSAGFAIWASVSEEVDANIRKQISQGVFPVRLKPADWNSGKINWLLDVVTSNRKTTAAVVTNFHQVAKDGELRLHPLIGRLVEPELLEKMGARRSTDADGEAVTAPAS